MEEYTVSKNWEDLVGHFFDPDNEAAQHLLEYAPDPVIVQILLNIPPEKLEAFCSINKRVRSICKSKLVKGQYYEKNIFETASFKEAKAYLERNPKGFLSIKKDNDFTKDNLIELANKFVFLEFYNNKGLYLKRTSFPNLKTWKFYYPNSNLLYEEYNYKDGKENGLYRSWHNNGQLWEEYNYKDGKTDGLYRSWHENGKLEEEYNYKDGERNGLYRFWYENEQLGKEFNYKDGKLDGLYRLWHQNGKLDEECNYKDGKKDGLCRVWYENGQLYRECNYKNDKLNGLYREWYENGQIYYEANYKDGNLI